MHAMARILAWLITRAFLKEIKYGREEGKTEYSRLLSHVLKEKNYNCTSQ